jgi:hypothetical protein
VRGQRQQVDIRDLRVRENGVGFEHVAKTDIVAPEQMPFGLAELAEDRQHDRDVPRPVRIVQVTGNADEAVFRDRTGGPGLAPRFAEPAVGCLVMDVHRISQG